ncbi:uncharacterized protein LY89DRAFT_690019 [Mollisia scopiformis]|uniref:Cep57 centrosome microtubule-binding domain-containing protein n=1 Tax=Mollisia scopiformis TaxID=149040 RepID=A0A132BAT6_MOLSC|nr:uncharacterized protein LY89DRAFT_690019 [Mollisia scopiformis]KUJ09530.1 hypothetical protein LY89DRAFT_690019 [Mollisia scopiformis]
MSHSSPDNSFTVSSDFRIRDTAKKFKYARWTRQEQQFSVDTAAIATAFPDFTQGSTSDDLTIDLGRAKNTIQHFPKSPSLPDIQYRTVDSTNTDMLRQRVLNKSSTNNIQKENMAPNSSPYVSNASRTISGDRKQLAELRAQVQSDTENSTMGTERTGTTTFPPSKVRGSRFGQTKNYKSDRVDSQQQIPANISARFTSPAKSVTKTVAQPTQSSFIIHANGDMTARDTEELGLPVIVEHGQVQQRKSSARRFKRVSGIRTPEEEKELWLLSEKLKAENAALRSRADYQQHVNNSLQEQNARILREVSDFKTRIASEFEVKITEMSRKVDVVMSENTMMKAESAAIRAKNAALSNEKEVEGHELARLETELAQLRADFQENNTQEVNTGIQITSPKKTQKSTSHTVRSESRVEFEGTNTDMQFEIPNLQAQQTSTRPSREFRAETQETNTDMEFELPKPKGQQTTTRNLRSESRIESQTKISTHFEDANSNARRTSARSHRQNSGTDLQRTDTDVQIEVSKLHTRKASTQTFRPKSASEEQTLRPSVDPQQALATVMAQLNEELAELKEEHNQVTSEYMALDASMKRRMRKEMKSEMDRLLRAIERKADQVYLLQDVQEGILPYEEGQSA